MQSSNLSLVIIAVSSTSLSRVIGMQTIVSGMFHPCADFRTGAGEQLQIVDTIQK
jgi:hypothetical protein